MLEFQQCAAPASRFNRPAMPVGHPKVRAFYAIAASVAGMGGNGWHGADSVTGVQGSPGKRMRTREVQGAAGLQRCCNLVPRVRCAYPGYVLHEFDLIGGWRNKPCAALLPSG